MIKNIVFDFGGVLLEYNLERTFARHGVGEEQAHAFITEVLSLKNNNQIDLGLQPVDHFMSLWRQQWPQLKEAFDVYEEYYTDFYANEMEGMVSLMHQLIGLGYKLYGLSNWESRVERVIRLVPEPFSLMQGYMISYQVHLLKPHREIFDLFCQKFAVRPEECLFIDDRADNIQGANTAGWQGVEFHDAEQLRKDLELIYNIPVA